MTENIVIPGYDRVIVPNRVWAGAPNEMGRSWLTALTRTGPIGVEDVTAAITDAANGYLNPEQITEERLIRAPFGELRRLRLMGLLQRTCFSKEHIRALAEKKPEMYEHLVRHTRMIVASLNRCNPDVVYAETGIAKSEDIDGLGSYAANSSDSLAGIFGEKLPIITAVFPIKRTGCICTRAELEADLETRTDGNELQGENCKFAVYNTRSEEGACFARLVHGALPTAQQVAMLTANNSTKITIASQRALTELLLCDTLNAVGEQLADLLGLDSRLPHNRYDPRPN